MVCSLKQLAKHYYLKTSVESIETISQNVQCVMGVTVEEDSFDFDVFVM